MIASTTKGGLLGIGITVAGAGFRVNDSILITGGGGSGATANVATVNTSGIVHPNSYNIMASIIDLVANNPIFNVSSNIYESFAYANLATISINTSNLTVNTGSGASVTYINLSGTVANSNVFFQTYDQINVRNTIVTIISSNTLSNTIIVSPGLAGNIVSNTLQIIKKANAYTTIQNASAFWAFSNCGPVESCFVINSGNNYSVIPSLSIQGNTSIKSLGILGRMEIIDGGLNYQVGNKLEFINPPGAYGDRASANVTAVAANGKITQVRFEALPGEVPGGMGYAGVGSTSGYNPALLPSVNVASATGNGANIVVRTLLGYGETLISTLATVGTILSLKLVSGGSGYSTPPTINLANMSAGSGGIATASIATGAYIYPGRYINDDGLLSSYNFLEDRDYYQNYSYVVRVNAALKDYRKVLLDLTHPAGTRLFGQYLIPRDDISLIVNTHTTATNTKLLLSTYQVQTSDALLTGVYNVKTLSASYQPDIRQGSYALRSNVSGTYDSRNQTIVVNYPSHWLRTGDNVYLMFANATSNVTNGFYTITTANTNYFVVSIKNGNTSFVVLPTNTSNLTANSGIGNTNNYITLSQWVANSNVVINVGDTLNVGGNLVSVVYTNLSSNTIIVFPGVAGNLVANTVRVNTAQYNAYGNVRIFDPSISLFVDTSLVAGDNVFVNFLTSNTALANDRYTVLFANSSVVKVRHKNVVTGNSFSGNVNVHTKTVTVTSAAHGLANGETIAISFYTGDTGNVSNGLYNVSSAGANTFNITSANSLTTSGLARINTSNILMNVTSHGFSTNNSVYMWFRSGDTSNSNGYYTVTVLNSNVFSIINSKLLTSNGNGNLTVYRNFMNVTINRASHGFSVGQNAVVQFETGNLANIANGIYRVNSVANTNTYNILHNAITISGNISNLLSNANGTVYVSVT